MSLRSNVARICSSVRRYSSDARAIIRERNQNVNAFVSINENLPSSSTEDPTLHGKTVAVKDNISTSSMPTTCSSAMLENFTSPFDATVVKLLQDAGADIVGKTNCDEFGMGSLNVYSVHGPVINPFRIDERRSAGGSSGGSAAAVAAGMCDSALATDTGGSIRLPASYCGVVGLKPSYGLISRWGVVSYADSLDCVGVMAKTVPEVKRVFDILNVHDEQDPTSVSTQMRRNTRHIVDQISHSWSKDPKSLSGLTVGVPQEYFPRELSPSISHSVRQVIQHLQHLGAKVVPVSLPSTSYALSAYYVLASAEASSNLARYDGIQYGLRVPPPPGSDLTKTSNLYAHTRSKGFGSEVKKRILLGTYALTADAFDNYFLQAQKVRQLIRQDFDRVFRYPNLLIRLHQNHHVDSGSELLSLSESHHGQIDVLIHPSAIQTAPPLNANANAESSSESNGEEQDKDKDQKDRDLDSYVQDVLTVPASLAGLPAMSVPVPVSLSHKNHTEQRERDKGIDGWPVGVSVVGQWGCDEVVMRIGQVISEL
ncbi:hypothetical protein D9758_008014 [Tetrapyrgos nigripes]|uniref:Glutamyl-tRNA(Gln) amidotransferase subunit A, mitochondrial n=1 Tax=Tetrapyrgos nigripes TaxID=182062 RepID=A0A8H5D0E0_9AGAR|nr:hypothetical protein D9758_008014 [Tetrapyrgos nigripes]